jgi:hypothetical protein
MDGPAVCLDEDEIVIGPGVADRHALAGLRPPVFSERPDGRAVECRRSPSRCGLGGDRHEPVPHCCELLGDRRPAGVEVDVTPPQAEDLASPHASGGGNEPSGAKWIVRDRVEERAEFCR